jgi:hypothetical protein
MANHKRGRPKSKRAGCLWCKPHKHEARAKVPRSKSALAIVSERPDALELQDGFIRWGEFADTIIDTDPENPAPPVFRVQLREAV